MSHTYKFKTFVLKFKLFLATLLALAIITIPIYIVSQSVYKQPTTTTTLRTTTTTTTTTLPITLPTTTTLPLQQTGELVIALKDEEHKIAGGTTVLNLSLTVSDVMVHLVQQEGNESNETGKWIKISDQPKTLDLLRYTDVIAIIAEKELDAGKYTQIRLNITDANITIKNVYFKIYTSKTYPMIIPSNELKLVHPFTITAGKATVLTLDFDVEQSISLGVEGEKRYILRPVVKILEESLARGERPENSEII